MVHKVVTQSTLFDKTPENRVGPGYHDQTLAVNSSKNTQKSAIFICLHISSCWGKIRVPIKISFLGIPKVGEKQWAKEEREKERNSESQC